MKTLKEIILGTKKSSSIDDYIQEKLKISSKSKINQYEYHPNDKNELIELIYKLIKERGNEVDLNDIDISKITDMSCLFFSSDFNGDISGWDVSNVDTMGWMFRNSKFNGNIDNWDVSNVVNMKFIFYNCPLEKNPPKWYKKSK